MLESVLSFPFADLKVIIDYLRNADPKPSFKLVLQAVLNVLEYVVNNFVPDFSAKQVEEKLTLEQSVTKLEEFYNSRNVFTAKAVPAWLLPVLVNVLMEVLKQFVK